MIICIPTTLERRYRLDNLLSFIRVNSDAPYSIYIYENLLGGWCLAMREMMKHLRPEELVCVLGDDCEPGKNWLKILIDTFHEKFPDGDGLVQPNDMFWKGKLASFPVATAGYLLKWAYSGYTHNFCDEELAETAKVRDKFVWVPESEIHHRHYSNTEGVKHDETYKLETLSAEKDKKLFIERRDVSGNFQDISKLKYD